MLQGGRQRIIKAMAYSWVITISSLMNKFWHVQAGED